MSGPVVGQRYIVTKRVKGQHFCQTVSTNREKKCVALTIASGTLRTLVGVGKGMIVGRWRLTAEIQLPSVSSLVCSSRAT